MWTTLNVAHIELEKTGKVIDKVISITEGIENKGDRLEKAISNVVSTQQTAAVLQNESAFMLKFKKSMCGQPLTVKIGQDMSSKLQGFASDLASDARVLRAHMAPNKK